MPRFLHAMCGSNDKTRTTRVFSQAEWEEVRLDPMVENHPDIVGDLTSLSMLEAGSFDAIITHHSLEKLYSYQVNGVLQMMHRALNDNGYLLLTCADLQATCALIAEDKLLEPAYQSPAGAIAPIDILYGFRPALAAGKKEFANHCGFTSKALVGTLAQAGFISIWSARNADVLTLVAIATKAHCTEEDLKNLVNQHFS